MLILVPDKVFYIYINQYWVWWYNISRNKDVGNATSPFE